MTMHGPILHGQSTLLDVIEDINRSVLEPGNWAQIYRKIADLFDSPVSGLTVHHVADMRAEVKDIFFESEAMAGFVRDYAEEYSTRSILMDEMIQYPAGATFQDTMFSDYNKYIKSNIYNELFKPTGTSHSLFLILARSSTEIKYVGVRRGETEGVYDQHNAETLRRLGFHLLNALKIGRKIDEAQMFSQSLAEAWHGHTQPMILLDQAGRAIFVNRAAQRVLDRFDGLGLDRGGAPLAANPADTARLRALIHEVVQGGDPPAPGGVMSLARPSGRRALGVTVSPVRQRTNDEHFRADGLHPAAVLFIAEPDNPFQPSARDLAAILGLTPREAEVLALLAADRDTGEIARELALTQGTVRSYLKSIMRKTDTRRQSELVRLALGCVAPTVEELGDGGWQR